jgi:hypothetical protein
MMNRKLRNLLILTCSMILNNHQVDSQYEGTKIITQNLYPGCIELSNGSTRVVLEPNVGGRVLLYELNRKNVLFIDPKFDGVLYARGTRFNPSGGRSDIGPEKNYKSHPALFLGRWEARITGPREAEMISQKDSVTGVQLIRKFKLAEKGSMLEFTQVIRNVSNEIKSYCHWSRTLVKGGGISLSPLNKNSRYPKGYVILDQVANVTDYSPADDVNIRVRESILEISGPPLRPKFLTDSYAGWLAYITKDNQLFIKKFSSYNDRVYGETAGGTVSVYYYGDQFCEIEPIGPMETLKPGGEAAFSEHWYLFDYKYPEDKNPDLEVIMNILQKLN